MSLFLTRYPIPKSKTDEILDLVRRGENVSSLWMPHSGRTDFAIQLQAKSGLSTRDWEDADFYVLDVSLDSPYLEKRFEEIKATVKNAVGQGRRAVVVLDSFSLTKAAFVKYVLSLRHELPPTSINFLTLAFESEFFNQRTQKTDMSHIYNNLIKVPYFSREETFDWLETQAPQGTPTLADSDKQAFFDFCGGVFGLLINLCRSFRLTGSVEEAVRTDQMRNTLQHLWGRFSERERLVLKAVASKQHLPPYTFEIKYMKEHRLLSSNNQLIGRWPEALVGESAPVELEIGKEAIVWNGVNLSQIFTQTEEGIFRTLLDKKELPRDQLAHLIWGSQTREKYSDWAIDQAISRLRKKLVQVGIGEDKLKTVKGKGISLEKVTKKLMD